MATVTKDLGIATAYGYAKSKGYTGTEDEFAQAMLDMTTAVDDAQQYAQDAEDAKDDAQASAESIEQSTAQIATNTSDIADLKEDLSEIAEIDTITSKNLFNPSADGVVVGKYLNTSGSLIELTGWNTSDYIKVSDYDSIVGSVWNADDTYRTYALLYYMHSYDVDKHHIAKVWDSSTNGVYTVGSNVAYIRFCWQPNNELGGGRKLMIESGSVHSDSYEAYFEPYTAGIIKPTAVSDGSISEQKLTEELQNKINSVVPSSNDNIVCWGDSLTYSQYSESITYPSRLSELTGKTVKNFGMPGASSMDISGLQGGMPIYLAPFTLPADSTTWVDVTFMDVNGNSNMYFGFLHYQMIDAIERQMYVDGIRVGFAYAGNNQYRLKRYETAESVTVFDRPVKLNIVTNYFDYINIFWAGTNDAPTTEVKAQRTIDIIKNMISHFGGKRYLVLGLTVKSYADATNDLMGQTFGNHYVDVKDYLIKYGLLDSNLTPTTQDETDITNLVVPTSLRHDSVHFNDYGYKAIGNCVYQHGKDLGYWT